jgi:hypothetical protein
MNMERIDRRTVVYWLALVSLAMICCLLAFLQYRFLQYGWIGEISRAEEERVKSGLEGAL